MKPTTMWCMKSKWGGLNTWAIKSKRSECIKYFISEWNGKNWAQLKRKGWECVKVELVEVL